MRSHKDEIIITTKDMRIGDMKVNVTFKRAPNQVITSVMIIPDWFVKLTVAEIEDYEWIDDFIFYLIEQATAWRTEDV